MIEELKAKIVKSYEQGVTLDEAERLAGEFLAVQIDLAEQLKIHDLSARMRKSGLKAIKSAVRQDEIKKHDKKPTEGALEDVVNLDATIRTEQDAFDVAEVERDYIKNMLDVTIAAHVFYRNVAKGTFGG